MMDVQIELWGEGAGLSSSKEQTQIVFELNLEKKKAEVPWKVPTFGFWADTNRKTVTQMKK